MENQFTPPKQLIILIFSVMFCLLSSSFLSVIGIQIAGIDIEAIDLNNPKIYLISGFFSQVVGFLGGFILFLKVTKQSFKSIIDLHTPTAKFVLIVIGLLLISYPLIAILGYYNSFLKDLIPNNSLILQEIEKDGYQKKLLFANSPSMLMAKLFVLAILPAIAEELIFRGVLLTKLKDWSKSEHHAVVISGLIFALMHFQPTKLLPMIFMGIMLGYVYTRTKNIAYSMLFHFMFNATTILSVYFFPEQFL